MSKFKGLKISKEKKGSKKSDIAFKPGIKKKG